MNIKYVTLLVASLSTYLHADMIADSNVQLGESVFGYDYALTVYQDAARTDPTSILFDRQTTSLTFRTYNIDESSDWYFVQSNDVFTTTSITQGNFTLFNQVDVSFNVGYDDFYLGVNTGLGFTNSSPRRDIYGWVLLRNSENGLSIVHSAMAYNEGGIIIGELEAIPEPSSLSLILFVTAGLLAFKLKHS